MMGEGRREKSLFQCNRMPWGQGCIKATLIRLEVIRKEALTIGGMGHAIAFKVSSLTFLAHA